jgi:hypothetical protein
MTVPEQMAVQVTNIVPQQNATVHALEKLLLALPQAELPLDHFFSDGIYARKLTMPVSAILTGATHKQNHLAILLKGQVAINSRQGTAVFNAPYVVNVIAGDKRAFFAVTEAEWITIHATDETDVELLRTQIIGEE